MTKVYPEGAIQERRELIAAIAMCNEPGANRKPEDFKGTEAELIEQFEILAGVVDEYKDGGDEMEEWDG